MRKCKAVIGAIHGANVMCAKAQKPKGCAKMALRSPLFLWSFSLRQPRGYALPPRHNSRKFAPPRPRNRPPCHLRPASPRYRSSLARAGFARAPRPRPDGFATGSFRFPRPAAPRSCPTRHRQCACGGSTRWHNRPPQADRHADAPAHRGAGRPRRKPRSGAQRTDRHSCAAQGRCGNGARCCAGLRQG